MNSSIDELTPRAHDGDVAAQFELGLLYQRCSEDAADSPERSFMEAQAVHWLNAASSQGLADAQYALGVIYSQGLCGVDLNPETSGHYFQLAAEQGDVDALFALGCYWASLRDDDYSAQAIKCFKRAADKGHEPAQMALTALVDQSQPHGRSLPPVSVPRNIALSLPRASEQVAVPVEPPMLSPNSFEPGSVPPPGSSASMPITSRILAQRIEVDAHESLMNFNPIRGLRSVAALPLQACIDALPSKLQDSMWSSEAERLLAVDLATSKARNLGILRAQSARPGSADPRLSVDQMAAIHLYTQDTNFHTVLNELLRAENRTRLQPALPFLKSLVGATHQLPKHNITVYRRASGDLSSHYARGLEIVWWPLSSVTSAAEFASASCTIFKIQCTSAVDVRPYSAISDSLNESAMEFVLPIGIRLLVDDVQTSPQGALITLIETKSPLSFFEFSSS